MTRMGPGVDGASCRIATFSPPGGQVRAFSALPFLLVILLAAMPASAQWEIEQSNTTANLRGIASAGGGVAWASGSGGTVLRTLDGGRVWQSCPVPPGAAALDFRAIQAFDERTAIVMSAGPGTDSRIYRTSDGCRSWKLVLTNQQKAGFWDAMRFRDRSDGVLLGDPVDGHFVVLTTTDGGESWQPSAEAPVDDPTGQAVFAASNSSLLLEPGGWSFCTGGPAGPHVWQEGVRLNSTVRVPGAGGLARESSSEELTSESKGDSLGCFSLARGGGAIVAVGGDYLHPDVAADNAWTTRVDPREGTTAAEAKQHPDFRFVPAATRPGGYRSDVAYDAAAEVWVAVGPTGTDVSADDGVHWRPLTGGEAQPAGLDSGWNALSLPFAVGPKGRIAKLRAGALTPVAPATQRR